MDHSSLRINPRRFRSNFDELSRIGETDSGGVNRPAFSAAHVSARGWFQEQVLKAGLTFRMDGAANHSGILRSKNERSPALLLGSHLDSVPNGGRFDGAIGVLAALEVLQTIQEASIVLPCHLEAIDFTDEEGFLVGDFGSSALSGSLDVEKLLESSVDHEILSSCLAQFGLKPDDIRSAQREPASMAGYLELHIEQGSKLLNSGIQIGAVTAIVGVGAYRLMFLGSPDHAGTSSMQERRDASQGAAEFIQAVRQLVIRDFADSVANVVWLKTFPGALNVVPAAVDLGLEFRSPGLQELRELERALLTLAENVASQNYLDLETRLLSFHEPVLTSEAIQKNVRSAAKAMGLTSKDMISGAWHDAQMLAPICPTGMIFVPSENGSHSPAENADWDDCVNGANVLLHAALHTAFSS